MAPTETPSSSRVREHLANERTYLAWLRTSFGLLTLGFATNRFGLFLTELHLRSAREPPHGFFLGSERFGLGMVILGIVLMALSVWRYQRTRAEIDSGDFHPASVFILGVAALSLIFGMTAFVLLLQT